MKRILVLLAVIILCASTLFFVMGRYLQTNHLLVTNQSENPICIQSSNFESTAILSKQTKKIKFRVKGDGSFTLTNCGGATLSQNVGYFTTNDPRCHLVEYISDSKTSYETATLKECKMQ